MEGGQRENVQKIMSQRVSKKVEFSGTIFSNEEVEEDVSSDEEEVDDESEKSRVSEADEIVGEKEPIEVKLVKCHYSSTRICSAMFLEFMKQYGFSSFSSRKFDFKLFRKIFPKVKIFRQVFKKYKKLSPFISEIILKKIQETRMPVAYLSRLSQLDVSILVHKMLTGILESSPSFKNLQIMSKVKVSLFDFEIPVIVNQSGSNFKKKFRSLFSSEVDFLILDGISAWKLYDHEKKIRNSFNFEKTKAQDTSISQISSISSVSTNPHMRFLQQVRNLRKNVREVKTEEIERREIPVYRKLQDFQVVEGSPFVIAVMIKPENVRWFRNNENAISVFIKLHLLALKEKFNDLLDIYLIVTNFFDYEVYKIEGSRSSKSSKFYFIKRFVSRKAKAGDVHASEIDKTRTLFRCFDVNHSTSITENMVDLGDSFFEFFSFFTNILQKFGENTTPVAQFSRLMKKLEKFGDEKIE